MRLGIIDLGTNSVRFDVVELGRDGRIERLYREKLMVRLGEGVFLRRRLDPKRVDICIEAFEGFRKTIDDFRVHRVVAFGTAALRTARDSDRFLKRLKKETGISLKIISGDEEARLIAKGILANEHSIKGRFALLDIGGGSTEISICRGREVLRRASFPLGTAGLQQVFLKSIPPNAESGSIDNLRRHIRSQLLYRFVAEDWPRVDRIIGSSGTARSLIKLSKRLYGGEVMSKKRAEQIVKLLQDKNKKQLLAIPGIESRRVDMILAGAILLDESMAILKADKIEPTEYSLRDGIIYEVAETLSEYPEINTDNPIEEIFSAAVSLGADERGLRVAIELASDIFDKLRSEHKLAKPWKTYLVAAVILQGVGRAISPVRVEGHSSYIARHVDVSGLEEWEARFIAELCVRFASAKLLKKESPFKKEPKKIRAFLKILSLLRLVVPMSTHQQKPIRIAKIKKESKTLRVFLKKGPHVDLAILRADQRKNLFEELFQKTLIFEKIN